MDVTANYKSQRKQITYKTSSKLNILLKYTIQVMDTKATDYGEIYFHCMYQANEFIWNSTIKKQLKAGKATK